MKKKTTEQRVSRIVLLAAIISTVVFITSIIAFGVMDNRYWERVRTHSNDRDTMYANIVNHLEYNGLDETATAMMAEFSQKYTDFSNFIVTDSNFRILYSMNKGFIDENTTNFYIVMDEPRNTALICDAEGNIISIHSLETSNWEALRRLTESYPAKSGAPRIPTLSTPEDASGHATYGDGNANYAVSGYGHVVSVSSGDYGYDPSASTLRFNAIKSKNLYVSFLYNAGSSQWHGNYNQNQDAYYTLRNALITIAILSFLLYWLALPVFVFLDARRHDNHPALWGVLALFTNIVGLIVYLAVRPERLCCANCHEPLDRAHAYCPLCGTRNRAKCQNCGQLMLSDWLYCPACGTPGAEELPSGEIVAEMADTGNQG